MTGDAKTNDKHSDGATGPPAIRFDWQDWLPYIVDADIPEDQKREFIETLFSIVIGFVDLGFGLNPTQEICGEEIDLTAILRAGVVECSEQSTTFNAAGAPASPMSDEDAIAEGTRP